MLDHAVNIFSSIISLQSSLAHLRCLHQICCLRDPRTPGGLHSAVWGSLDTSFAMNPHAPGITLVKSSLFYRDQFEVFDGSFFEPNGYKREKSLPLV